MKLREPGACWLSRDPLGEQQGDDVYDYVLNDPVNWIDPFGLRPLSPCEKQALASFIPKVDLDNANLHVGQVPWWFKDKTYIAVTVNNDIYIRPGEYDPKTVAGIAELGHELVHVGQYRHGMTRLQYLLASVKGYDKNPYEPPAYALQAQIASTLTGSPCSQ
jgi:hypothetical protein